MLLFEKRSVNGAHIDSFSPIIGCSCIVGRSRIVGCSRILGRSRIIGRSGIVGRSRIIGRRHKSEAWRICCAVLPTKILHLKAVSVCVRYGAHKTCRIRISAPCCLILEA